MRKKDTRPRLDLRIDPVSSPCAAFTLVEVLVVVAIIGILTALLVTTIKSVSDSSKNAQCLNNVRQIATLFLTYTADHNGYFPKAAYDAGYTGGGKDWAPEHFVLDYDRFQKDSDGKVIPSLPPAANSIFHCPSEKSDVDSYGETWWQSHYGYNRYLVTQEYKPSFGTNPGRVPLAAIKNPSRVFLVADASGRYGIQAGGFLLPKRRHKGGTHANVAFVDGHAETTANIPTDWMQYIEWGGDYDSTTAPQAP